MYALFCPHKSASSAFTILPNHENSQERNLGIFLDTSLILSPYKRESFPPTHSSSFSLLQS